MRMGFLSVLCTSVLLVIDGSLIVNGSDRIDRYYFEANMGQQDKPLRSPFRYAIVSNEVVNVTGDNKDGFRHVVVLLDERAFSEQTLKELFSLVSSRFPLPNRMEVKVYTSLEQVETPEEGELPKVSESQSDPASDKYHWALFVRSQGKELFRYNPNPPARTMKTVSLKERTRP